MPRASWPSSSDCRTWRSEEIMIGAGRVWSAVLVVAAIIGPPLDAQPPTIKTNVDEVLLDLIIRDKKGKPITDLESTELSVFDNGVRQKLTGFRLVSGAQAIAATGNKTTLDPLQQIRLVTLAFEAMTEPSQRKLART